MTKYILILLTLVFLGCQEHGIVTGKKITEPKYALNVYKGSIYIDSLDYIKNLRLGNDVYLYPRKYYVILNYDVEVEVDEYDYHRVQRLDTL